MAPSNDVQHFLTCRITDRSQGSTSLAAGHCHLHSWPAWRKVSGDQPKWPVEQAVWGFKSTFCQENLFIKIKHSVLACCLKENTRYCYLLQLIFVKCFSFLFKDIKHMFTTNSTPLLRIFNRIRAKSINMESSHLTSPTICSKDIQ